MKSEAGMLPTNDKNQMLSDGSVTVNSSHREQAPRERAVGCEQEQRAALVAVAVRPRECTVR